MSNEHAAFLQEVTLISETLDSIDYYEVLGVEYEAEASEVRAAYHRKARRYHPDVNSGDPGAEARFKEISEAFAVLSDRAKRAKYDRGGHAAFGPDFNPVAGTPFRSLNDAMNVATPAFLAASNGGRWTLRSSPSGMLVEL